MENGRHVDLALGKVIEPKKVTFDEKTIRKLIENCKETMERSGQAPMVDPVGFIVLGAILDKLEMIEKHLVSIGKHVEPPVYDGFGGDKR